MIYQGRYNLSLDIRYSSKQILKDICKLETRQKAIVLNYLDELESGEESLDDLGSSGRIRKGMVKGQETKLISELKFSLQNLEYRLIYTIQNDVCYILHGYKEDQGTINKQQIKTIMTRYKQIGQL